MKKNLKYILIGVGITLGIELLIVIIGAVIDNHKYDEYQSTKMDEYYYENSDKVDIEMNKNVEYKDYLLQDKSLLVKVTNKNDFTASARLYVEFFNENKETIIILEEYVGSIEAGSTTYEKVEINDELQKQYDSYEIKVVLNYANDSDSYKKYIKNITIDNNYLTVKNTFDKKIDSVYVGLIYYDNDKIVYYSEEGIYDIKAHKTAGERIYTPTDITYTKIKPVLLSANHY